MDTQKHKTHLKFSPFTTFNSPDEYSKDVLINEEDIITQLFDTSDNNFLGVFSQEGMLCAFEDCEILPTLRQMGVKDLIFRMDTCDPLEHKFQIYFDQRADDRLLLELVLHKTCLPLENRSVGLVRSNTLEVLYVEWLLLQNPCKEFDTYRPRLPGQKYPGLGLVKELLGLLVFLSKTLKLEGIVAVPGHFHNAVIFSKTFQYLNPESEGRFRALQRDLAQYSLDVASWAIEFNCVKEKNSGKYLNWFVDWQVRPIEDRLVKYFTSKDYRKKIKRILCENQYVLDEAKFEIQKNKISKMADVII